MSISAIIPAYNEESILPETLQSIKSITGITEVIVVDDGSVDRTLEVAQNGADIVLALGRNYGKGRALFEGVRHASGNYLVFIDGDLGNSAVLAKDLLPPLLEGQADMSIAVFPLSTKKAGFGLVKGLARKGIHRLTGYKCASPLSGQRALTREAAAAIQTWDVRFGIEVGMTIDILRAGMTIREVPLSFSHRESGRDLPGFMHRGRQFVDVGRMLGQKWRIQSSGNRL